MMDEEGWTKDQAFIRAMIRYEIDAAIFSMEDARRHLVAVDPQAQYALSLFGEAEGLTRLTAARPAGQGRRRQVSGGRDASADRTGDRGHCPVLLRNQAPFFSPSTSSVPPRARWVPAPNISVAVVCLLPL